MRQVEDYVKLDLADISAIFYTCDVEGDQICVDKSYRLVVSELMNRSSPLYETWIIYPFHVLYLDNRSFH